MKRQRRKRSTRRRGLQHIGDVLSNILTDIERDEVQENNTMPQIETVAIPVSIGASDSQNTFSFYQAVE